MAQASYKQLQIVVGNEAQVLDNVLDIVEDRDTTYVDDTHGHMRAYVHVMLYVAGYACIGECVGGWVMVRTRTVGG